ncbi:unnamed protein product [Spirodela intermedia]|uniref:Uncharacterized protein n=1 Tax=Spirodela intermedia TaxID=51605 RepID=A0A7I8J7F9_SPIIN|nr:unnamed protein product [Spirodela intermedia]CAA6665980.1 unnamed protein product [Spirodela intermedia]
MERMGGKFLGGLKSVAPVALNFLMAAVLVSADRRLKREGIAGEIIQEPDDSSYQHVWPDMEFGWKIVVGSFIGFLGAAFGSVGGVGGGGIYVPMLTLIIGFDPKSSTAISKCEESLPLTLSLFLLDSYYNLKLRHPTLDMPIIDYDLALLFQPMLMLGISVGVAFNVIFADWMVTVLLIILFLGTSTKAFLKGVETWKKETLAKKESAKRAEANGKGNDEVEYKALPSGPVSIIENVCWRELGLLVLVWFSFLGLQIAKNYTGTCSTMYWTLNFLQLQPVHREEGDRVQGDKGTNWRVRQLFFYCFCGVLAGVVGGLLGLGGGFILGPLFLELGFLPRYATATFAMTFSSSMSVVEYHLLRRFPVPYALYFTGVATAAALVGQHVVRKLIIILGRASLIIFILAFTIFVSAISLGGVGISNMVKKIADEEYMGFENLCKYEV